MMAKNKVIILIDKDNLEAFKIFQKGSKKKISLGDWLLDNLKQDIINGRHNKQNLGSKCLITKVQFEKEKFISDPKFTWTNTTKKIVVFSGSSAFSGLQDLFRLENALNRKLKLKPHPCLEAYLYLWVNTLLGQMVEKNFEASVKMEMCLQS